MRRALLLSSLLVLVLAAGRPARSADPAGLAVSSGAGAPSTMTPADLAALPAVQVSVSFRTAKGPFAARFAGPLLWTVLAGAGAVDPAKPRQQAGQTILVIGADGYAAALAMGEISPDFERKAIILADSMNGKPLGGGHLRLIVPGDREGAREVKDVVRVAVSAPH